MAQHDGLVYVLTQCGDIAYFWTLTSAQSALRRCGGDYADTSLTIHGDDIRDESGEYIGHVVGLGDVPKRDKWQLRPFGRQRSASE